MTQVAKNDHVTPPDITEMTEAQLRDLDAPSPQSLEELAGFIAKLVERPHDYGTCVYAMSLSAVAAFNYVAHELGVTGFQASCADLDILKRTRRIKGPFRIVDYSDLLYPQYQDEEHFPSRQTLLGQHSEWLATEARRLLEDEKMVHPDVKAWWTKLAEAQS